jgi:uncharacterized membrane protein
MRDGLRASSARHNCDDQPETVFEAVIAPYQSLNRRGIMMLGAALVLVSLVVSMRCLLVGAWPVMAFSGVEIGAAIGLLLLHRRQARRREIIRLNEAEITVVRTDPQGRDRSVTLPVAWLQVHLEETSAAGGRRLWLRSSGRGFEIGAFLHEPERESLCQALRDAVHDLRHPTFHNAQLIER